MVTQVAFEQEGDGPAEVVSRPGITLDELQQLALENAPVINQVSAAASRAAGIQQQVGLRPNPSVGYFADEIGDNSASGLHGAFVSQTFVTGGKLEANRHVLGHDVESMMWQIETVRTRVQTDVHVQFIKAMVAQQRMKLTREFRELASKGVKVAKDRLQAEGTQADVLQSEILLGEVDLLIKRAELDFAAAWKELVAVAGVPGLKPTTLIGKLGVRKRKEKLTETYEQIVEESPLLQAAYQQLLRAQANLERQRLQSQPNLNGQLGIGYDDSTGDEFVNVQLSMRLPVHNYNQGNVRAAFATLAEASQNVQRIKMSIRQQLARVGQEYQVADATVKQYQSTILPKAEKSQKLIAEAHAAGEFDFLRVLTARKSFFDANLAYVNALGDLAAANAKINGLLLTGGLVNVPTFGGDDGLRGQAINGQ